MEYFGYNINELNEQYGIVKILNNQTVIYAHVENVSLPAGCNPEVTEVILVLRSNQARPEIYVKPGIVLANGRSPRSVSVIAIEGESWLQFSYQFNWDKQQHTLVQFVEGALRRFSLNE
jgi:hypothetical protein